MGKFSIALAGAALAAVTLCAAAVESVAGYSQCVALTKKNPAKAEARARDWLKAGGGTAAVHCSALALTAMGRYAEAANKLDALARNPDVLNSQERAVLYDQAGSAWLLAGQANPALKSFSAALSAKPYDIDFMAGRARARAMQKDWAGAEADLTSAIIKDQNRADLLVLRASARRALNRKADAATDILRALTLYPNYPAALVERGMMKYEAGDTHGARNDWKKAAAGHGEAAAAAKRNLAAMGPETKPLIPK